MARKKELIIGLAVAAGFLLALFFYSLEAPRSAGLKPITLQIAPGQGFKEIAKELKVAGLIRSETYFTIYSFITGQAGQIKPGFYELDSPPPASKLLSILTAGPRDVLVTITPGMTTAEIDVKLSSIGVINKDDILKFDVYSLKSRYPWLTTNSNQSTITNKFKGSALEGFLLPDTYYFYPQPNAKAAVYRLLDNFEAKALPILGKGDNIRKFITIASLLEKEIPDYNEQKIAAGILEKRLKAGMPLQIDATITYIKCQGQFLDCPPPGEADYKTDSPYNTYLYSGLPPGAVSNPSAKTIEAAVSPVKSDYWYYLSDPKTRKTIFSKTLDEHNQNKVRYLRK